MPKPTKAPPTASGPPRKARALSLPTPATVARDTPDTSFTWKKAFPFPGVVVLMGDRGSGKTATAFWAMDRWHTASLGRYSGAVFKAPRPLRRLMPEWVSAPQEIAGLPQNAVCVIDEGQLHANSRRSASDGNLEMANLVALSRQRHQLIIVISHQSRKLDVALVMDASRIIWKQPTQGHVLFERKELKAFTGRALAAFQGVKGDPRKWAYVLDFHDLRFGMVGTGRPAWWTEPMSEGMAGFRP